MFAQQPIVAGGEAARRPSIRQQPPTSRGAPSSRYEAAPAPKPSPPPPQRAPPSSDDVYLPRSLIMDKEVITRTSGKRLGYVNQIYVDPARLEVISVYMRQSVTSIGATNSDHVLISSLRQIGDVVLVHDESALLDPPADETYGYIRMVGTEVQTEDGTSLGKVRDFIFNPDNGQVVNIKYDALGLPSIPQSLLSCYSLGWQDIIAVGPTKTIVRRGAERRAVKENDGWISEYVTALVNAVAGAESEEERVMGGVGSEAYRGDPAYAAWYELHAVEYEMYYGQRLPKPIFAEAETPPPQQRQQRQQQPQARQQQQQEQGRRRAAQAPRQPMALPPPRSTSYRQALQVDQQQQQRVEYEYETVGVYQQQAPPSSQRQQRQYNSGPPSQDNNNLRRSRQPPPFTPRQESMPSSSSTPPPPPSTNRPPSSRPPSRSVASAPTQQGGGGGSGAIMRRSRSVAGAAPQPVEPDAVISDGYNNKPLASSRQPAEFAPRDASAVDPSAPRFD